MIRVRVLRALGSTPREEGAEMFVGLETLQGTIGGGQLEYMAIDRARQMLRRGEDSAQMDVPLGPQIGQCCGGRVWLGLDRGEPTPQTLPRALIFGAGHVGRALALALDPLPIRPTLIDSREAELSLAPAHLDTRLSVLPEAEIRAAEPGSAVVIVTHDHALDFLLAVEALRRPDLAYVGMIGSASKRAQFRRFAKGQRVDPARLVCPIGALPGPDGGIRHPDKRPAVIAAFTAAELLVRLSAHARTETPCVS